jgi:hypothetical protein
MPPRIKIVLSLMVAIAAVIVHLFQNAAEQEVTKWVVLGLGAFMIFSLWLFPETGRRDR